MRKLPMLQISLMANPADCYELTNFGPYSIGNRLLHHIHLQPLNKENLRLVTELGPVSIVNQMPRLIIFNCTPSST